MELSLYSLRTLRASMLALFLTPSLSSATSITQDQATQLEQCLGGNSSVSAFEGEEGWGEGIVIKN